MINGFQIYVSISKKPYSFLSSFKIGWILEEISIKMTSGNQTCSTYGWQEKTSDSRV